MLYHLSQWFSDLLYPYMQAMLLLLVALALLHRRRTRWAAGAIVIALLELLLPGMPAAANPAIEWIEAYAPLLPIDQYPKAGAIVVLGGSVERTMFPRTQPEETNGARLLCAARLYKAGKAKIVVVSGGLQYKTSAGTDRSEADDLAELLIEMGVPQSAVIREDQSRNTYENAIETKKILSERGIDSILLATHASHMRRAAGLFERQGFKVTPVPNSYLVVESISSWKRFVPNSETFSRSNAVAKEIYGILIYKLLGKL